MMMWQQQDSKIKIKDPMRENNNLEYHVKTIYTTNLDQYETSNSLKKTEEKTRLQDKAAFFFLQILSSPHTHLSSHPTTP